MYWSRKPEIPATTTFVSTTARCFRFLGFGCNGDLRDAVLLTITANRTLDLFFGDLSYVLGRLRKTLEEFLLPSRALPPGWHVAIEFSSAHAQVYLLAERSKRNSQLDRLFLGGEAARKDHLLRILDAKSLLGSA